jgi:hypothetical protein
MAAFAPEESPLLPKLLRFEVVAGLLEAPTDVLVAVADVLGVAFS